MSELLHDTHVWYAFSFLIFVLGAWKFGRKPVLDALDRRIGEIRAEIKEAESLRIEAQELLAQYQRKQREAAKEAGIIVENARKSAEQIRAKAEAEMTDMLKRREQQTADRLRRMEETAVQEIRAYAAELAVKATAEIIVNKANDATHARLIDESVKKIAGQLA